MRWPTALCPRSPSSPVTVMAGNYAMCGKAYDPRFIYAWPTAKLRWWAANRQQNFIADTGGRIKNKGKEISAEEEQKLLGEIISRYNSQTTPQYAAARLWVDAIIDPALIQGVWLQKELQRRIIIMRYQNFKTGVLQVWSKRIIFIYEHP